MNSPPSTSPRDTQSTLHFSDSFCDLFSSAWNLPKVSAFLHTYHKWAWGSYSKDRSYVFRHGLIVGQTAVKQWNCGAKLNRMEETLPGCLEILYILSSMHFVELFFSPEQHVVVDPLQQVGTALCTKRGVCFNLYLLHGAAATHPRTQTTRKIQHLCTFFPCYRTSETVECGMGWSAECGVWINSGVLSGECSV